MDRARVSGIALLILAALATSGVVAAEPDQTASVKELKAGGITVTYSAGLEKQAEELADAAQRVTPRYLEACRRLSDKERTAKCVCDLLGSLEYAETRGLLDQLHAAEVVSSMLSRIRVYSESDVREHGPIVEGPWTIAYDAPNDKFRLSLVLSNTVERREAVTPYIVRRSGKLETNGKRLDDDLRSNCELLQGFLMLPIHEIAEEVIGGEMRLFGPYSRWFNEGAANWVLLTLVSEMAPEWTKVCRKQCIPGKHEPFRAQANLLTWPQEMYGKRSRTQQESDVSRAHYRFATDAVEGMLSGQPRDTLAKVLQRLKDKPFADTETICAAMSDVTGKDAEQILLRYVPKQARALRNKDAAKKLFSQAVASASAGNYGETVDLLSRLWEAAPDKSLDLNLAWAMRKAGLAKADSEWHIRTAAMPQGRGAKIEMISNDTEAEYVLARLAQFGDAREQARAMLEGVLELDPSHADAKAALKELSEQAASTNTETPTPERE